MKYILFGLMFVMMVVGVGAVTLTNETYNNFTLTFASGGVFELNFSGLKNISYDLTTNWINVSNATVGVVYNISAGQYWKLLDDPSVYTLPNSRTTTFTKSSNIANGIYYVNVTSSVNWAGALRISTSNVYVNCRGAYFIGLDYKYNGGYSNVNDTGFINCSFENFAKGVSIDYGTSSNGINANVSNCNFYNNNKSIYIRNFIDSSYFNNNFYSSFTNETHANIEWNHIYMYLTKNIKLYNNYLQGTYHQVFLYLRNDGFHIFNNTFISAYDNSLYVDRTHSGIIEDNNFNYPSHNAIDCNCNYTIIKNNIIKGFKHTGIDFYEPSLNSYTSNNITNNVISNGNGIGIFAFNLKNSIIENNFIENISNNVNESTIVVNGIQSSANSSLGGYNIFNNNSINNIFGNSIWKVCIFAQDYNDIFINNTMSNCGNASVLYQQYTSGSIATASFKDNNFNYFYIQQVPTMNIDLNISQLNNFDLLVSNSGTFTFDYTGLKDLRVVNNSVTANTFPTYSSLIMPNETIVKQNLVGPYEVILGPNNRSIILGYDTDTQPKIYSMDIGLSTIDYGFTSNILSITYSGAYSVVLYQLTNISDRYSVTQSGVDKGSSTNDNYTVTTGATWLFFEYIPMLTKSKCAGYGEGYYRTMRMMPLIIIAVVFVVLFGIIGALASGTLSNTDYLGGNVQSSIISIGVIVSILVILGILGVTLIVRFSTTLC